MSKQLEKQLINIIENCEFYKKNIVNEDEEYNLGVIEECINKNVEDKVNKTLEEVLKEK
jgi:hypothetical protein